MIFTICLVLNSGLWRAYRATGMSRRLLEHCHRLHSWLENDEVIVYFSNLVDVIEYHHREC